MNKMPEWLMVVLTIGGAILFIASLFNLFFAPAWWGLWGFFTGVACFLLGWGEILEL
jgi:hypothetical protein